MFKIGVFVVCVLLGLLSVGCAVQPPSPSKDAKNTTTSTTDAPIKPNEKGNFTLYVSNQSFELPAVDIEVVIDGTKVVDDSFEVKDQHNWVKFVMDVEPGRHILLARTSNGRASLKRAFTVRDKHWAGIDFWYNTEAGGTPTPRHFEFHIQDEPMSFASLSLSAEAPR